MTQNRNLPVPVSDPQSFRRDDVRPPIDATTAGPVEAQILGQEGRRRGLKGGRPVLEAARSAYLDAEWSGPSDRRLPTGIITRTEV